MTGGRGAADRARKQQVPSRTVTVDRKTQTISLSAGGMIFGLALALATTQNQHWQYAVRVAHIYTRGTLSLQTAPAQAASDEAVVPMQCGGGCCAVVQDHAKVRREIGRCAQC